MLAGTALMNELVDELNELKLLTMAAACNSQAASSFGYLNNFCVEFLSNFLGVLQFLSSLIKIIPYFYCICFSFTLSRIELTFCHSDHKVILRWGCFRRSNIIAFENLSQISKINRPYSGAGTDFQRHLAGEIAAPRRNAATTF